MECTTKTHFSKRQSSCITTYQAHLWQNNIFLHLELQEVYQVQCLEPGPDQILGAIGSDGSEELLMVGPDSAKNPIQTKIIHQFSLLM
jgi:hypothetical protein